MEQFIHVLSLTCIGEVVLLDPHLPVGHHISDDVFLWCVLVDSICVFIDGHYISDLLVHGTIPSLIFIVEMIRRLLGVYINEISPCQQKCIPAVQ
jgi:hypothetical protein